MFLYLIESLDPANEENVIRAELIALVLANNRYLAKKVRVSIGALENEMRQRVQRYLAVL